MQKREYPTDPSLWDLQGSDRLVHRTRPMTDLEALMQLAPHQDADIAAIEETALLKEILGTVLTELTDEEKWIIERLFIERLSLRKTGAIIGIPKTSLARRRDRIRRKLMMKLMQYKPVQHWLKGGLRL